MELTISDAKMKNPNLDMSETKKMIFKYLSNHVNMDSHQEIIKDEKDLDVIREGDYVVCPRFDGARIWAVFMHDGNDYYAVSFPKYGKNKVDNKLYPIPINVSQHIYNGTIMEGIYVKIDSDQYLIIDEIYMLAGQTQLTKPKDDRLKYLSETVDKYFRMVPNFRVCTSKFFYINEENLSELYAKIKSGVNIREIVFYPKTVGKIFRYTIVSTDLEDDEIKLATFRMYKTSNPDVYNLYVPRTNNMVDIAYIPDTKTSKKCKQWFKDFATNELHVKCTMDVSSKKWIPVELMEQNTENA
jgi:hypothetical protein